MIAQTRDEALAHLAEHAQAVGANPVLAMRFDSGEFDAGRELAHWHLSYETVEPFPLQEIITSTVENWRVEKICYADKATKSEIIYNSYLTLSGIPPEALEYVVNGKPAIEWIMERYQVTTGRDSGIINDPNAWCEEHGDPRYIVGLIKRVVRVSVETFRAIINPHTTYSRRQPMNYTNDKPNNV